MALLQVTQLGGACDPQPGVERLRERGFNSVHQLQHCVTDAVVGQTTCFMIEVHADSGGLRLRHRSLLIIVSETFIVSVYV